MKDEYRNFDKLLGIYDLYTLYSNIGSIIINHSDLENNVFDSSSQLNSLSLLIKLKIISKSSSKDFYCKATYFKDIEHFKVSFLDILLVELKDIFSEIFNKMIRYDDISCRYYLKRNFVNLRYSGLLFILKELDAITLDYSNIWVNDRRLLYSSTHENTMISNLISQEELEELLELKSQLGFEGESLALEFEKNFLKQQGILKFPEQVSKYDASAGFDIASYLYVSSMRFDKFIEVKSCKDESYEFYISRNELKKAKEKGNQYFLYLLNRRINTFKVIQNPYKVLFNDDTSDWTVQPTIYKVHLIK